MKIFVGYDGPKGCWISRSLHNWFPNLSDEFEVFAARWSIKPRENSQTATQKALDESHYGILCLTDENDKNKLGNLLFLQGALQKATKKNNPDGTSHVTPLRYGVTAADFDTLCDYKGVSYTKDGMIELLYDVNSTYIELQKAAVRKNYQLLEEPRRHFLTYNQLLDKFNTYCKDIPFQFETDDAFRTFKRTYEIS